MEGYREIWRELGVEPEGQERMMAAMGGVFRDVILSQANRPKGMAYFDQAVGAIRGARLGELLALKKSGKKVVGTFCTYVPEEVVIALGGACVALCNGSDALTADVEKVLPRNLCALIKSSFGFKLGRLCPVMEACDIIVGETTCDGKKKYFEILGDHASVYVMELPQKRGARNAAFWRDEVRLFAERMEELFGEKLTPDGLRRAIDTVNARRSALLRLAEVRKYAPAVISGKDALLVSQVAFYDDPMRFTAKVHELCDELEARRGTGTGVFPADAPRILLTGCPMALPNWKLPHIIEKGGAAIVMEEMCTGIRYYRNIVESSGATVAEMLDAVADRYLCINCAIFTPNDERMDHLLELVREYAVHGVVHYTLQFCDPYSIEVFRVRQALAAGGMPFLSIETDYSKEDAAQIATRVEAFLEMVDQNRRAAAPQTP